MEKSGTLGVDDSRLRRCVAIAFGGLLALAALGLLIAAPALVGSARQQTPFYQSPLTFPLIALAVIVGGALVHVTQLLRGAALAGDDIDEPAANWRLVLLAMAAYAVYLVLVPLAGYVPSTAAFIVGIGLLARMGWKLPCVAAVGVTAVLYVVFVVMLQVWFPSARLLAAVLEQLR